MTRWLLLLGLSSGCSFSLSGVQANRARGEQPKCDHDKTYVRLDAVTAGALGVLSIAVADGGGGAGALIPTALAAIYAGAALRGNHIVDRCLEAELAYGAEQYQDAHGRDDAPTHAVASAPPSEPPRDVAVSASADDIQAIDQLRPLHSPPPAPSPTSTSTPTPDLKPAPNPKLAPTPPAAPAPAPPIAVDPWRAFWREVH